MAAGFSIAIELLQLLTARGLMEFDDVLHNMIGALIGVGIMMVARRMACKHKVERDAVE